MFIRERKTVLTSKVNVGDVVVIEGQELVVIKRRELKPDQYSNVADLELKAVRGKKTKTYLGNLKAGGTLTVIG